MLGHIDSVNSTLVNDRVLTVFIAADPRAGLAGSSYPESREALKYKVLQVRDTQGISGQSCTRCCRWRGWWSASGRARRLWRSSCAPASPWASMERESIWDQKAS